MTSQVNEAGRLRGKIAGILSKREVIMNIGSEHGVQIGMKFVVLNKDGIDISDPDTGVNLGPIEVPKTVVKVVRVKPRLAVGRTFRTVPARPGLFGVGSLSTGSPSHVETLQIESSSILRNELSEDDKFINVGDLVVQTSGEEYDDS